MAFRFRLNEPVQKGFRRIGLEQIERCERQLTETARTEEAIHETRKCLKRIRALLKLVQPGLGKAVYEAENARFRAVAGLLAPARDNHVLLETVTKLECGKGQVTSAAFAALKRVILDDRDRALAARDNGLEEALAKLDTAKKRFGRLKLKPDTFTTVERGLERSYRAARRAFGAAYASGGDEAFHEWRKTVQHHWRHMTLVTRAWPGLFEARVAAARALSQILGDDHDLHLLVVFARSLPPDRISGAHVREIERRARARQKQLRKSAEPRGHQLLAEGARGHSRRVGLMWEAAEAIDALENGESGVVVLAAEKAHAEKARS